MQGIFGSTFASASAERRGALGESPGAGEANSGVVGSPGAFAIGEIEPRCAVPAGFQGPFGQTLPLPGPSSFGSLNSKTPAQPNSVARSTFTPR